jgi:pectate lyase
VTGDAKKVIFVSGTLTQTADQIRPGNNTSIIGKNSSAKLVNFGMYEPFFPAYPAVS